MIRECAASDFEQIWQIINDGAQAYKGIIPADRWTEPYMSRDKLRHEIADGIAFWACSTSRTSPSFDMRTCAPAAVSAVLARRCSRICGR